MSYDEIGMTVNSDFNVPLNHLIWLQDYMMYGCDSYVKQNTDIWEELCNSPYSYPMLANSRMCSDFYIDASDKRKFIDATFGFAGIDFGDAVSIADALTRNIVTVDTIMNNTWFKNHYVDDTIITDSQNWSPSGASKTISLNGRGVILRTIYFSTSNCSATVIMYFSDGTTASYEATSTKKTINKVGIVDAIKIQTPSPGYNSEVVCTITYSFINI